MSARNGLTVLGRAALAVTSAGIALRNPRRADMVGVLSEAVAGPALSRLTSRVRASDAGVLLAARAPARFPEDGLNVLRDLPSNSLGARYVDFMDDHGFEPDERTKVRPELVPDEDEAWVLQRYRDVHDLWHVLADVPTSLLGELALKWFEAVHTGGLAGPALGAAVAPLRLKPDERYCLLRELVPWALSAGTSCVDLMGIRYEDHLHRDIDELREDWRIESPRGYLSDPSILYRKRKSPPRKT